MDAGELKKRLQIFGIRVIKMAEKLPNTAAGHAIRNQIVRCGTSAGANYRAACFAKSEKDFLNKLKIVEEELDETIYWMEDIIILELIEPRLLDDLMKEGKELFAIIVQSIKTCRSKS